MHSFIRFAVGLLVIPALPSFGQTASGADVAARPPQLIHFDLDFAGGTPRQLVEAIEKASGHPLNVVIPTIYADNLLPPLKMRQVDVKQLFGAITASTEGSESQGYGNYLYYNYMFATNESPVTDESVWHFQGRRIGPVCQFFLLTPYLDHGLNVDDVTTAIQTAWRMLGGQDQPSLAFHKETNLLILVGSPFQISVAGQALQALLPPEPKPHAPPHS